VTVRACVVGSTNVDLVMQVPHLPGAGETVVGASARREPGGKGGNQAVALARLGASVRFVSAVGADDEGAWSLARLREEGVGVEDVAQVDAPTGLAVVTVDAQGENCIVVASGANSHVVAPAAIDADVVLLSLEVPLTTVAAAAAAARACDAVVVLNAAPARPLPGALLDVVDVLVVNEPEWHALGRPSSGQVVVTLGAAGCRVIQDGTSTALAAVPVEVVDSTGAGDCFAAALSYALASGQPLEQAASLAVRAAAVCVTRPGARGGLPTLAEVTALRGTGGTAPT
jgi:ribokinase